jgi:hypothetical protein
MADKKVQVPKVNKVSATITVNIKVVEGTNLNNLKKLFAEVVKDWYVNGPQDDQEAKIMSAVTVGKIEVKLNEVVKKDENPSEAKY